MDLLDFLFGPDGPNEVPQTPRGFKGSRAVDGGF